MLPLFAGDIMKITFIYHSSFAVELENCVLVFDYYGEGQLPTIPENKKIYFLNSHAHPDHFKREILELKSEYPTAEYILSRDIRFREEERKPWIHSVRANMEYEIGQLKVRTLKSTDVGVAFVVETEGKRIYHAGDLNWWHWTGESKYWNNNMAGNYKNAINQIKGEHFDVAFVPVDPRLGTSYSLGIRYFLENTHVDAVFPMHCWGQYEVCRKLQKEPELNGMLEHYYPIKDTAQEWNL